MTRQYIDCREYPSETNCTVSIAADSEKELLEAAVQHAVTVHGHQDNEELRKTLSTVFKVGASKP
jgi:predicted small metal-binding protein